MQPVAPMKEHTIITQNMKKKINTSISESIAGYVIATVGVLEFVEQ